MLQHGHAARRYTQAICKIGCLLRKEHTTLVGHVTLIHAMHVQVLTQEKVQLLKEAAHAQHVQQLYEKVKDQTHEVSVVSVVSVVSIARSGTRRTRRSSRHSACYTTY